MPLQMYSLTHSSLWVSFLSAAGFVPLLLFALWGGALADVFDRRKLLLASSLLTWTVTLCLLAQALLRLNRPWVLLVLVGLQSAGVAVSMPTRTAIIPRIVEPGEIPQANTLNFTAGTAAAVLGPLVAGMLIKYDVAWAYGVDAMTFTFALWAALRLPPIAVARAEGNTRRAGGLSDVIFGLRYVVSHRLLMLSFMVDIAAMVLAYPRVLFPEVAMDRFGGKGAAGWLYAAIAIGSVLAGLTSGWIARVRRQGVALVTAVVVWGLAVASAGLAGSLWLCVLLLAVGGAADLVSAVYRQTILQTAAPDELRGRLQGVFTAVVAGGPSLGDLRAGAMGTAFGAGAAWVAGGVSAAVVAVVLGVLSPTLRRYRPRG